jgi:molybdenum cofactor cytidylyltransferase
MVPGLILAAGRSSRMGQPKALLPASDGLTFVARLAEALRAGGTSDVVIVGRPVDAELRAEADGLGPFARFVPNEHADDGGQLSSLIVGLNVVDHPGIRAAVVVPVDIPLVSAATVATVLDTFRRTGAPIVRATHRGRHGHPVLFSRAMFPELRRANPALGAKAVLRAHEAAIVNVEVDDPAVLWDVDTPEDYERLFGRPL